MNTRELLIGGGIAAALLFVSDTAQAQGGRWAATSLAGAPNARWGHTAVWTGSQMIAWGDRHDGFTLLDTGAAYDPVTDTWTPTSVANAPGGRTDHTAVWTGSRMIVWGGEGGSGAVNTGAVYDPTTDTWTATSTANAPSARRDHTAVWAGSRMIVWGGYDGASYLRTGAVYDPTTDTWTATSTANAPSVRGNHTAVWTGSRMIVWGGYQGGYLFSGGIYDPTTNSWTATSTAGVPSTRAAHTAVWTGSRMIIWGGQSEGGGNGLNTGAVYNPTTDTWTPTSTAGAPSLRYLHTAVWTRSRMIVWGGYGGPVGPATPLNTGAIYHPTTDNWTATRTAGAPSARNDHVAVWSGLRMIVWGGYDETSPSLDSGGVYDPLLPQSFYTLTPCRLVDTRGTAGPLGGPALSANTNREFVVTGQCGIPPTAQAISVNLTATAQTEQGHLRLYPGGTTPPATSSLNYAAGQTRANNAIVVLGGLGNVGVRCAQASGTAHAVIDVNGYFE